MRDNDQPSSRSRSRSRSNSVSSKENGKKKRAESHESKSSRSKTRSRSRSSSSEHDEYRLHIGDIGDNVRKSDLEKYFSQYGTLKELWMTHSSPIFGFAVFKTKESASAALKAADGASIGGTRIRVTHARPRTRGQGRRYFHPNMRCYQCGYAGHFYRDCPDLDQNKDRYDSRSSRRPPRRDRPRDYYPERDNDRRHRRSTRRYDDYDGYRRSGGRRHRY